MPATASAIRTKLNEISSQQEQLARYPEVQEGLTAVQTRLKEVKERMPADVLGEDQNTQWETLGPDQQEEIEKILNTIQTSLNSLVHQARAPSAKDTNTLIYFAVGLPVVLLVLIYICVLWGGAASLGVAAEGQAAAARPSWHLIGALIVLFGALGGSLRLIGSAVLYVAEQKLYRSWLPFYYLMPLEGALLAPIVCLLLAGGIYTPGQTLPGSGIDRPSDQQPPRGQPEIGSPPELIPTPATEKPVFDPNAAPPTDPNAAPPADPNAAPPEAAPAGAAPEAEAAPQPPPPSGQVESAGGPAGDPESGPDDPTEPADNTSRLLYFYAFAGFSGLFAKNVMRKLKDLADALFTKPATADAAT